MGKLIWNEVSEVSSNHKIRSRSKRMNSLNKSVKGKEKYSSELEKLIMQDELQWKELCQVHPGFV